MNAKITIGYDKRNKKKPWVIRWSGNFNFDTGKSKRYAKSFRLKVDAEQFAAEKTVEFSQGRNRDQAPNTPLSKFCKDWLRTRKSELRPASYEVYENTIRRLVNFFGKTAELRSITPQKAATFIAEQKSIAKSHKGKELSDASREQIKRNCKAIFQTAVEWGLLENNPFKTLRLKKQVEKKWHRIKPGEYYDLLHAVSMREKAAYALLYTGGLRLNEAFNLLWSDIDFENGRVTIVNRAGTSNVPPFNIKDSESRRIPLPENTISLLTEWQTRAPEGVPFVLLTRERYDLVKEKWQRFRKEGKPWQGKYVINNVLRNFKAQHRRADIKPVGSLTIHTLRKSCIQNWADILPMNVVKQFAGHSDISTTQKFYTQVDAEHEAKAAREIQKMLRKADVSLTYEPISGDVRSD